ncbi:MAG TPA: hypothetical protein VK153_00730 [Candidatus Paceibacterota bacterium]|nr:hypothetical protein [Candidatus Paceibacterota bacterium]
MGAFGGGFGPTNKGIREVTLTSFISKMNGVLTPKITGNNVTFDGAGNWVTGLGSLTPDLSTYPGSMYLNFTSGNQAVKLDPVIDTTNYFLVRVKARKVSGTGMTLRLGYFASGSPQTNMFDITPETTSRWFYGYLWGGINTIFYIGAINANNNGTKIAIEEIHCDQVSTSQILSIKWNDFPRSNNYSGIFNSFSRSNQTLLKVGMFGDSIVANSTGGNILAGNDEGVMMRPPRLTTNNIARRIYDRLKYNAPIFRRLDHSDWTKSTLSGGNDFSEMLSSAGTYKTPWHPNNTDEKYFRTAQSGAYCEITIPNGKENCCIIYRTDYQENSNNFDSNITVTLNGGDISAYGSALLNELRPAETDYEVTHGFGLNIAEYNNLPAGSNVIRLTKSANTTEFHIWGVAYWSGNTMMLLNTGFGGGSILTLSNLTGQACVKQNYDLGFFELPIMNNSGGGITLANQLRYLFITLNRTTINFNNILFFTPHPFGTNPENSSTNYYTTYNNPNYLNSARLSMYILAFLGFNYIDTFKLFYYDLTSRGGTLLGGESGLFYTTDGQHPSESGTDKYVSYLINKIPLIS